MVGSSGKKLTRRGRIQTPGRILGAVSQESDESPEPSPIAHPEPHPWTPQQQPENESLPSLPDVPSPYSPPPSSLFSGEEFPPKSVRKPVAEVMLEARKSGGSRSSSSKKNALTDLSLNHHQSLQQRLYTSPSALTSTDRSQLLPTVLYLKKDLEESHQSLYLLQQENRALAAECGRFQTELSKWQQAVADASREKRHQEQNKIDKLQVEVDKMLAEKKQMDEKAEKNAHELLATKAIVARLEAEQTKADKKVEDMTTEIRDLRAKMKEQSANAAQKLKSVTDEHAAAIAALQDEKRSMQLENDRLQAMLRESNQRSAKDVADAQDKAQADIFELKAALEDAKAEIEELRGDKIALEGELTQNECSMQDEIDRLKTKLAKSDFNDEKIRKKLQTEIKDLQDALEKARTREEELLSEKVSLQEELTARTKEMQQEGDRLQRALVKANEDKQAKAESLEKEIKQLKSKYEGICAEKESLQKEISQSRKSLASAADKDEVERLQAALSQANAKSLELRAERSALARELAQVKQHRKFDESVRQDRSILHASFLDEGVDDLIPDRLGRIRDAAERAALVKEYRREFARLKSEHEAEIKRIGARHDQDLKDVFEEAKSEVSALARENRRRLQGEYEAKIASLERRYQAELARAQRECDKNTAAAEEAMQAAASEVATVTEQLDKEAAARESLEGTVRDLERKLVIESEKSRLASDYMKSRKKWQDETNNLLASIQEECNTIFVQNMVTSESPRTVVADESSILDDISHIIENANPKTKATPAPKKSATWKEAVSFTPFTSSLEVDKALDETEALVRNLIGNK